MLDDKDRIFTNLYGLGDRSLKGARARGQWDNTKALIDKGRDWVVNEIKARPAWPWRRGLSHRPQMVVHAEGRRSAAPALSRHQRRRNGARHMQGPRDPAQRSIPWSRAPLTASFAMGAPGFYIYVRGEYILERKRLQAAVDEAYEARADRQGQHPRLAVRPLCPITAPAYLRRRDGDARVPRGQEGHAAHEAAVPRGHGPLWLPDDVNNVESAPLRFCGAARRGFRASARPTMSAPSFSASPATSTSPATSKRRCRFRSAN